MKKLPALERLEKEFEEVAYQLRVEVPQDLQTAAGHGDLSENSEYDAAKQRQSFLQARAAHLSARIETLASLKLDDLPKDAVSFGSRVYIEDIDSGKEFIYEIVTPEEVEPRQGKISAASPIGKALIGKRVDDEVIITLPAGVKEYVVTELETLHELIKD